MKRITTVLLIIISFQILAQDNYEKLLADGKKLFEEKKYEEAKELFEKLLDDKNDLAEAHYYLGRSYFRLDDHDEAIESCEKAVELEENNPDYHFRLGQLYGEDAKDASIFRMPGLASDMKEHFMKTIELDPDHIEGRIGLAQFYLQAPGIVGGDIDEAFKQAQIIIQKNEKQGRLLLAEIYSEQEKLEEAEAEMKILEEKFGNEAEFFVFYNTYGYFLLGQNRVDEAIEKLEKQVELAPENSNAHDSLGEAYRIKGLLKESLVEYQKAVKLNPELEAAKDIIEDLKEEIAEQ